MNIEPIYQLQKEYSNIPCFLKQTELITQYLDYFNNFLTLQRFAEYYGYDCESAKIIIEKGRELLNKTT